MIKIRISGYSNPKRNVWLTLPATEEQINQAFDKLLKGVPIGKTFAYHITSKECAHHQVTNCETTATTYSTPFLTMYSARITVIYEGLEQSDPLFTALLHIGVGNIVTSVDIGGMQTEIRECLSDKGMTRYSPKARATPKSGKESYQFDCENIRVAILSSQSRMGATTAAVGLTAWINSVGGKACYMESNQSGCLAALARAYEMEQRETGFTFDGVEYLSQGPVSSCNFIVHDIGRDYTENPQRVGSADILLLCCGVKPYEMQYTMRLLRQFESRLPSKNISTT